MNDATSALFDYSESAKCCLILTIDPQESKITKHNYMCLSLLISIKCL